MLHVISVRCVARDLHTIAPGPLSVRAGDGSRHSEEIFFFFLISNCAFEYDDDGDDDIIIVIILLLLLLTSQAVILRLKLQLT